MSSMKSAIVTTSVVNFKNITITAFMIPQLNLAVKLQYTCHLFC